MVKYILVAFMVLICSASYSQGNSFAEESEINEPWIGARRRMPPLGHRRSGTLEGSATFSPSWMLNRKFSNYYLSAFGEYHLDLQISLRSDNYFYLNSGDEYPFVEDAFRSYVGVMYHLNPSPFTNWDVTVGFQPGITLMSTTNNTDGLQTLVAIEPSRVVVSPSFAVSLGAKFYVWKYFNFFANVNYLNSKMGGIPGGPFKTDEIVLSAGLGFQIQTKRATTYRNVQPLE